MSLSINDALELIGHDLVAGGVPMPRIEQTPWQDWQPSESVMLFAPDGSGVGVWRDLRLPAADQLAHVADQVQGWAVEELARLGRPTNWPMCAAHPDNHPLQATARSGVAVWVCPAGEIEPQPVGGGRP